MLGTWGWRPITKVLQVQPDPNGDSPARQGIVSIGERGMFRAFKIIRTGKDGEGIHMAVFN